MIIQVGNAIGVVPTLFLLILDGFAGAALARSQGRNAWERFNRALAEGRVPAKETFDGAMIILGGALLLAPGFITDIIGFVLLIPPTRALLRGLVTRAGAPAGELRLDRVRSAAARGRPAPRGERPGSLPARLRLRGHRARGHRPPPEIEVGDRRERDRRARVRDPGGRDPALRVGDRRARRPRAGRVARAAGLAPDRRARLGRDRADARALRRTSTTGGCSRSRPLRPAGADGHGEELVAGAARRRRGPSSSSTRRCSRPSTTPDGLPRRVGLELYRGRGRDAAPGRRRRDRRDRARRRRLRSDDRRAGPAVRRGAAGRGRSTSCGPA